MAGTTDVDMSMGDATDEEIEEPERISIDEAREAEAQEVTSW